MQKIDLGNLVWNNVTLNVASLWARRHCKKFKKSTQTYFASITLLIDDCFRHIIQYLILEFFWQFFGCVFNATTVTALSEYDIYLYD